MVVRSVRLTEKANEELKKEAERMGISVNALIAIRLDNEKKKGEK